MGLFDVLTPLFQTLFDSYLFQLNPLVVVIVIGGLSGALSMWLYVFTSPQEKIALIKQQIKTLKADIINAKIDDDVLPLHKKLLSLSLKNLAQVLIPVVLSSLPVLFLLVPVDAVFSSKEPAAGDKIVVRYLPRTLRVEFLSDDIIEEDGEFYLIWPGSGEFRFVGGEGDPYGGSLVEPKPIIHKFQWWNMLFANNNGYLPTDSSLDSLVFIYPQREMVSFGAEWFRTMFFWFFVSTFSVSILIKLIFKIE